MLLGSEERFMREGLLLACPGLSRRPQKVGDGSAPCPADVRCSEDIIPLE